jgi:hypothetical protein
LRIVDNLQIQIVISHLKKTTMIEKKIRRNRIFFWVFVFISITVAIGSFTFKDIIDFEKYGVFIVAFYAAMAIFFWFNRESRKQLKL